MSDATNSGPGFPLISWGRPQGSGLSSLVVSTRAHQYDPADESRTLCGVAIPRAVQPSRVERGRFSALSSVFPDSPSETAQLTRCVRCERISARRTA